MASYWPSDDYNANKKNGGLKKGVWSAEEDRRLVAYIKRYGIWNWNYMAKPAGLARSGKSCRLRWMNYLRPNLKHGNFTRKEEETIIRQHRKLGNRWAAIAAELNGRTDNEIKNYWHTRLKKRVKSEDTDPTVHLPKSSKLMISEEASSSTSTTSASGILDASWASSEEYHKPANLLAMFLISDTKASSKTTSDSLFNQVGSFQELRTLIPGSGGMCMTLEEDFQEAMFMISEAGGFHYSSDPNTQESPSSEYLIYDLWEN